MTLVISMTWMKSQQIEVRCMGIRCHAIGAPALIVAAAMAVVVPSVVGATIWSTLRAPVIQRSLSQGPASAVTMTEALERVPAKAEHKVEPTRDRRKGVGRVAPKNDWWPFSW